MTRTFVRIRNIQMVLIAFGLVQATAHAEDWAALFQALTSTDDQVSEMARKKSFGKIIPHLLKADAREVSPEMRGIADQLNANSRIRLQAIALLASIAYGRHDSAEVLSGVVPQMVVHLRDDTARIRFDAAFALSHLKPSIPSDAIPHILEATRSSDDSLAKGGAFGAARLAEKLTDASEALAVALRTDHNAATKQALLQAITANRVTSTVVQDGVAEILSTATDPSVLVTALNAAAALGPAASARLVQNVEQLASKASDKSVLETAVAARSTLQKAR